jgi:hypothetical protein
VAHLGEDSGEELGRRSVGERRMGAARSRRWRRHGYSGDKWRLSVAAERGQLGRMAERRGGLGEGQQEGGEAVGEQGAARGAALEQGVASGGTARWPAATLRHGRGEAEEEEEGGGGARG